MTRDGLVLVDKPQGPTSHDIVSQMRKLFGTRKVGHAGTLDPMATGMLVIGIGRATRLLGYLAGSDKEYTATIRLGQATATDDAQGDVISESSCSHLDNDIIIAAVRDFRGPIMQRPSSVSAIKVDGKRAYARVRDGQEVELPARAVTIHDLEVLDVRHGDTTVDVDVRVACSSGTYIRAIARDLGEALQVGGHLTVLRRTRSGQFSSMKSLEQLRDHPDVIDLATAAAAAFPVVTLEPEEAIRARHGVKVAAPPDAPAGVVAVFDSGGDVLSLCEVTGGLLKPQTVFVDA